MKSMPETERERAYRTIRNAIMFGTLKPGEKVVERRICSMLELGRTPTREAIRQLESEGFLRTVPKRGAYVNKTSIRDMEEVAEVISVLEGYGAGMAAKAITPEKVDELKKIADQVTAAANSGKYEAYAEADFKFHEYFPGLSGNQFLVSEITKMRSKLFLLRALTKALFDHVDEFILDHKLIVDAVIEGSPKKATIAMQLHVKHAKDHFVQFLKDNPWFF